MFALCLPPLAGKYVLTSRSGGTDNSDGYGLDKSKSGHGVSVTNNTEYVFTFTWMGDNAADLPPQNVVMTQTTSAKAGIYGNPGSGNVDSNLGDTAAIVVQGSSSSASVDGSKTTVESGGPTVTARATPTATASIASTIAVTASTRFNASVSPVVITVSGTTKDSNKKSYVLTGQQLRATITGCTVQPGTYKWSASGGSPFRSFTVNSAGGQKYDLDQSDYTASRLDFFTADKGAVTVSCSCSAILPDKTTVAVTAQTPQITSVKPRVTSWDISSASVRFDKEPALGPTNSPAYFSPFSLISDGGHNGQDSTATVSVDSPFSGQGTAAFVQLVKPARYIYIAATGTEYHPVPYGDGTAYNGTKALDQFFPVASFAITQTGLYGDSPRQGTSPTWSISRATDLFDTWIMFTPPAPPDNTTTTYVPLRKYTWTWSGSGTQEQSGTNWTGIWDLGSVVGALKTSEPADTLEFPKWFETAPSGPLGYTP